MFSDIDEILNSARRNIESLKQEYEASLAAKNIPVNMLNKVRSLLADLRDPLDHIYKKIPNANHNAGFPVSNSEQHFKNTVNGIDPCFVSILERVQDFKDPDQWLKKFAALSNIHKHIALVPQTRQEQKQIAVISNQGGGSIIFNPNLVRFESGVSMFGAAMNPATQLPVPSQAVTTTITIWVDFIFDPENQEVKQKLGSNTKISALNFLRESLNKVENIVADLKSAISSSRTTLHP